MKNKGIRYLLWGAILLPSALSAQTSTYSPYSMFGIGEIENGNGGENAGMGGLGIGFRETDALNPANPASLSALTAKTFVFDGALFGKYAFYSKGGKDDSALSGNLSKVAVGFRAAKPWIVSMGVVPLSSAGYAIRTSRYVEGSSEQNATLFTGSGGLSKLYWANALQITPHFTIGMNASLVFGTLIRTETAELWEIEERSRTGKVYFDFGMQYHDRISENLSLTLGATGSYRTELNMHNRIEAVNSDGTTIQNRTLPSSVQYLPEFYGAGLSLRYRNKLTVGADYRFQKWSRLNTSASQIHYADTHRITAGISYIPNVYNPRRYRELIKYQAGISVGNSYIRYKDRSAANYAVTAGAVFPLKGGNSFSAGLEYGRTGTTESGGIQEDYFKLTLGFSLRETWFRRYKYD